MENLNIAICEDTPEEQEKLLSLLEQISIPTEVFVFKSGEELLSVYTRYDFDLILMDIYMDGINGVETVTKIREIDKDIPIAFITTSTDHTLESYRLNVLKYIEKPFRQDDIEAILELALMRKNNSPSLFVQRNGKTEKIPFPQILYLEQMKRQVYIYLKNGNTIQIYNKLSDIIPQTKDRNFLQTHKSFCVNLAFIRYINMDLKCFVMQNGKNVPIRRESIGKAKRAYEDFLFKKAREDF